MRYLRYVNVVVMVVLLLALVVAVLDFVNSTHTPYRSDYDWRPRTSAANARVWIVFVFVIGHLAISFAFDYLGADAPDER